MNRPFFLLNRADGFTLIELIVSIILVGIMGGMLVTFMGNAVQRASDTALFTQTVCSASAKAEEVWLEFLELHLNEIGGLSDLKSKIDGGSFDGNGNSVSASWMRLSGTTLTSSGATSSDDYLEVTVTPTSGAAISFLVSQIIF